jgi:hypothetical protein
MMITIKMMMKMMMMRMRMMMRRRMRTARIKDIKNSKSSPRAAHTQLSLSFPPFYDFAT